MSDIWTPVHQLVVLWCHHYLRDPIFMDNVSLLSRAKKSDVKQSTKKHKKNMYCLTTAYRFTHSPSYQFYKIPEICVSQVFDLMTPNDILP